MIPIFVFFILYYSFYAENSSNIIINSIFLLLLILQFIVWIYELYLIKKFGRSNYLEDENIDPLVE